MPYTQLSRLHVYHRTCPLPLKDLDDTASSDSDTLFQRDPSAVDEWLARGTMVRQPGSIGKLSTEVLDMIFQATLRADSGAPTECSATNLLSCICLALGCKRLLVVGKRHIASGLLRHHARAARCRLICLRDNTGAVDQAPAGMLTADELKEIAETKLAFEDDALEDPSMAVERCLYQFAEEFYAPAPDARERCDSALSDARNALWPLEEEYDPEEGEEDPDSESEEAEDPLRALDRKMVEVLASDHATYPPGPNVLLNLVKGEYVREAALAVFGNDASHITLVHAMLSRICYSPKPGSADKVCGDEYVGWCRQGPWAGDRFCITSEDGMPAPGAWGFKEWTDVTEDVNRMLGKFWQGVHCDSELRRVAEFEKREVRVAGTDDFCAWGWC